jgi:hypothetical protein
MDISFHCEKCGQHIEIDEAGVGLRVECPNCHHSLAVPDPRRPSNIRLFDLNIEQVLENWEVQHAIREVIANALDEQVLSKSAEIQIFKDTEGRWHVRDFGRGLRIEHFTLNENQEKLSFPTGIIGKFGVGLKDALAVFHRHGVAVTILSAHGTYRVRDSRKRDFEDIITLHAEYDNQPLNIKGTEFILSGATDTDIAQARSLFKAFSDEEALEVTPYGEILRKKGSQSRVYILGVLASEEANFLFSYNVTSLTDAMKKRLNRERLNVGRTVYSERIKMILKSAKSEAVQDQVADEVSKYGGGDQCDEMQWVEISALAMTRLYERQQAAFAREQQLRAQNPSLPAAEENRPVAYVSIEELQTKPAIVDNMRRDNINVVIVPEVQKVKLVEQVASGGPTVRTIENYVQEYNASFQYRFVEPSKLTHAEKKVFDLTPQLLGLVGVTPNQCLRVRISETMRVTSDATEGVWDSFEQSIIIKRSKLASPVGYASTLLHEAAHALTGTADTTREFESVLTRYLGMTASAAVEIG